MAEERVQRRLTAILAADVVGYSRMMSTDERSTLSRLKTLRTEVFDPKIEQFAGRIFKTTGDGVLAEFGSAVDAVQCSVEIQRELAQRNASAPEGKQMAIRIGVSLGDVVVDGEDLFGNGVNVAARMEGLAEPGGICVSGNVQEQIANTLKVVAEDLGEQSVKNIDRPIRCYRVHLHADDDDDGLNSLRLPNKPSIAILPFNNVSADSAQEYFADGITEDIITELSKIAGLFVIARNSSFSFKGTSPDVRQVSRDLGVRFILEGSVRKEGDRIRVTAQLVDGTTGGHLWAERYDRDLTDIFEMQDDLTRQIVDKLQVQLSPEEDALLSGIPTKVMGAHDLFLRARQKLGGIKKDREMFEETLNLLNRAIELDPGYAGPYAGLARLYMFDYQNGWSDTPDLSLDRAEKSADMALQRDPNDAFAHHVAAYAALFSKHYEKSSDEAEASLAIDPNFALSYVVRGNLHLFTGDPLKAVPHYEIAGRLDPAYRQQCLHFIGTAYLIAGRHEHATAIFRERISLVPETDISRAFLTAALGHLERAEEARTVWRELHEVNPTYSFDDHIRRQPFNDPAVADRIRDGLLKAGLPEKLPAQDEPLPLPDKPSIAVLPFENMSGDPEQEYFSDGISEDVITDMSKVSGLLVIGRNSCFAYKNRAADARRVAEDLGVRYVLEGSVRRADARVRINAQLVDARSGGSVWAERYDRDFEDIFALQDDITGKIVSALKVTLTPGDLARIERKPTDSSEAYDHVLRGRSEYYRYSPKSIASAVEHFTAAIELDPGFAESYGYLSYCCFTRFVMMLPGADPDLSRALELAEKSVALDPESAIAHTRLGWIQGFLRRFNDSLVSFEKALVLDPNNAESHAAYAEILNHFGDPERALELNNRAIAIDTFAPPNWIYHIGHALLILRRYDEAIEKLEEAIALAPHFQPALARLACAYAETNRPEDAKRIAAKILEINPRFSMAFWDAVSPHRTDEQRERFRVALREAGLPE